MGDYFESPVFCQAVRDSLTVNLRRMLVPGEGCFIPIAVLHNVLTSLATKFDESGVDQLLSSQREENVPQTAFGVIVDALNAVLPDARQRIADMGEHFDAGEKRKPEKDVRRARGHLFAEMLSVQWGCLGYASSVTAHETGDLANSVIRELVFLIGFQIETAQAEATHAA